MTTPYLSVNDVSLTLKGQRILQNVSFVAEPGEVLGIVGRNGSGKSMLFKCIAGLMVPQTGEIIVDGVPLVAGRMFPRDLGALIEKPGFLGSLSAFENLEILASIQNRIGKREILDSLEHVGLGTVTSVKVRRYSLGMKQRLGIAQAIMERPRLLILDEPTSGLDVDGVEMLRGVVSEMKARGATILLASHIAEDIDTLSDRTFRMACGILSEELRPGS